MNAFSKIDMSEVTRLTQVGKLAEARATSMRVGLQSRFDRHVGFGGDRNADHRIAGRQATPHIIIRSLIVRKTHAVRGTQSRLSTVVLCSSGVN